MTDYALYDEKILLLKISEGDERAFKKLFDIYYGRFYAVALKMTQSDEIAKDIVQDVFMNLWIIRENLGGIDNPCSYFFTAVYRRIYHHYRKVALEKKIFEQLPVPESADTTDEIILIREMTKRVSQAIDRLPLQQQLVFKLVKQEGLSRKEIADKLQISPHTVKNHLAVALKFIRSFLEDTNFIFPFIFWLF